jgi:hypothetical protein
MKNEEEKSGTVAINKEDSNYLKAGFLTGIL